MAILEIKTFPDPILREVAKPVEYITDDIKRLANDMIETMRFAKGAGLAANQVGVPIRLIVIEAGEKGGSKTVTIINPEIIRTESEEVAEEGCLSVPGFYEYIKRAKRVYARGINLEGAPIEIECEGYPARALQHEIDHLDGRLFIDYLSPVKRNLFKKRYSKQKNR